MSEDIDRTRVSDWEKELAGVLGEDEPPPEPEPPTLWDKIRASVPCTACFAKVGEACVYLGPNPRPPRGMARAEMSHSMRRKLEREGQPMTQVHHARKAEWDRVEIARARRLRRATPLPQPKQPPWLPALRAFDAMEIEQMRTWLRENHHLFRLRRI